MDVLNYDKVGEKLYHQVLENGLNVFVSPKPGYQKGYAFFATNYGGMDTRFCLGDEWKQTPEGVAHYLEHKMFDTKEGNALQELAANGASPNAFTSSAITGYYFESTQRFEENLKTLLSFVSIPWFTQESVDKEQGIIGQEIGMIEDDPDWKVFNNLLGALYRNHPIRTSVAGSVESISHITAETLYDCHKAFYDPANMVLCVAGDVDPEEPACEVRIHAEPEPRVVEEAMDVSQGKLALECLLGNSTPLYARLYGQGLINSGFYYGYESYPGVAFLVAGGESKDPGAVRQAVWDEAARIGREGIDPALWRRVKKGVYGGKVRGLNSFDSLCIGQARAFFAGYCSLDFARLFDVVTKEEAEDMIVRWTVRERTALSVIRPKEN